MTRHEYFIGMIALTVTYDVGGGPAWLYACGVAACFVGWLVHVKRDSKFERQP